MLLTCSVVCFLCTDASAPCKMSTDAKAPYRPRTAANQRRGDKNYCRLDIPLRRVVEQGPKLQHGRIQFYLPAPPHQPYKNDTEANDAANLALLWLSKGQIPRDLLYAGANNADGVGPEVPKDWYDKWSPPDRWKQLVSLRQVLDDSGALEPHDTFKDRYHYVFTVKPAVDKIGGSKGGAKIIWRSDDKSVKKHTVSKLKVAGACVVACHQLLEKLQATIEEGMDWNTMYVKLLEITSWSNTMLAVQHVKKLTPSEYQSLQMDLNLCNQALILHAKSCQPATASVQNDCAAVRQGWDKLKQFLSNLRLPTTTCDVPEIVEQVLFPNVAAMRRVCDDVQGGDMSRQQPAVQQADASFRRAIAPDIDLTVASQSDIIDLCSQPANGDDPSAELPGCRQGAASAPSMALMGARHDAAIVASDAANVPGELRQKALAVRGLLHDIVCPDHDSEQQLLNILELLLDHKSNLCISGEAGSGKTQCINKVIIPVLLAEYGLAGLWVTAMTGTAARLLDGGSTIHSASGMGRGQGSVASLWQRMHDRAKSRWRATGRGGVEAILLDEAGMMDGEFIDNLVGIGRKARGPGWLFRFVVIPDVLQLPPVHQLDTDGEGSSYRRKHVPYAFEHPVWQEFNFTYVRLVHNWRYGNNSRLGCMLRELRTYVSNVEQDDGFGHAMWHTQQPLSDSLYSELCAMKQNDDVDIANVPWICATRQEAESRCKQCLRQLPGQEQRFWAVDKCGEDSGAWMNYATSAMLAGAVVDMDALRAKQDEQWTEPEHRYVGHNGRRAGLVFDSVNAPGVVQLKWNARVIATKNISSDVPNGCMGKVVGFRSASAQCEEHQWSASTIPDNLHGVMMEHVRECYPLVHKQCMWPVVRFEDKLGAEITTMTLFPQWFDVTTGNGQLVCRRMQLPIALAYAFTIHRTQGQTFDKVVLWLQQQPFAFGMLYVALSRVRAFEDVKIMDPKGCIKKCGMVLASPVAVEWYESMPWIDINNTWQVV